MVQRSHDVAQCHERVALFAARDPQRAIAWAQRVLNRAQTSADMFWAELTLAYTMIIGQQLDHAAQHLAATQAGHVMLDQQAQALWLAASVLLDQQRGGDNIQRRWSAVAERFVAEGWPQLQVRALLEQIAHLNMLEETVAARAQLDIVAPLVDAWGSPLDHARLWRLRSVAATQRGELGVAGRAMAEAISRYQALGLAMEVARCRFYRAWLAQRRERFGEALDDLEAALVVFRRFQMPLNEALCLQDIGSAASRLGQFATAIAATVQARTMLQKLDAATAVVACDVNLGMIGYYSGMYDMALAAYQRAAHAAKAANIARLQLVCQRNQAMVWRAQGQLERSLAMLEQLVPAIDALGEHVEQAEILLDTACVLRDMRRFEQANQAFIQSRELFLAADVQLAAADCLVERGWLMLNQSQHDIARQLFEEAAQDIAKRPMHRWLVEYGLARCAQATGDTHQALEHYRLASASVASMRRAVASEHASSGMFAQAQQLYIDAICAAVNTDDPVAVLDFARAQRALGFAQRVAQTSFALPPALHQRYHDAAAQLQHCIQGSADLPMIDQALDGVIEILLELRHSAQEETTFAEPVAFDDLRNQFDQAFPDGWAVLMPICLPDQIVMLLWDGASLLLEQTVLDEAQHTALARATMPHLRFSTYLADGFEADDGAWQSLRVLGDMLVPAQIRARLDPALRLLVVPDGILHQVPWAALRLGDHWLCEQAVVHMLPTLDNWPDLVRRQPQGNAALLIGCNTFGERAATLANSLLSLDIAARCWPGPQTRLQGANATRAAILDLAGRGDLAHYQLVHIASHAQLVAQRGLLAHIKLADGDLLASDVAQLGLAGAMVVLAACEGAHGEVLPGEEVIGLNWSLLVGGARDVLASLWHIFDQAVPAFLEFLYQTLAEGADLPTALARTQRHLIGQPPDAAGLPFAAPLVWGGFCALGAGVAPSMPAGGTRPARTMR